VNVSPGLAPSHIRFLPACLTSGLPSFDASCLSVFISSSGLPACVPAPLQVRAEPLKFRKEGVFQVVKDVFLPWYNAYR
jgi:hypothetical protein